MNLRVILGVLSLAGCLLGALTSHDAVAPEYATATLPHLSRPVSPDAPSRSLATLPTIAPLIPTLLPAATAAPRDGAVSTVSLRRDAPESRTGCDAAYPDARTCIPPGPPFDLGCAITDERQFTVRPPDPQGLDSDGDGIGCEPIGSR